MTVLVVLAFFLTLGMAGALTYYFVQAKRERIARDKQFQQAVFHELKKKGLKEFSLPEFAEQWQIPKDAADRVAEATYARVCTNCLRDGRISDAERRQLGALARALGLNANQAQLIEGRLKDEAYRAAIMKALGQGAISDADVAEFEQLRLSLGISKAQAASVTHEIGVDAYLALFRRIVRDGWITKQELDELRRYRAALVFTPEQANEITREDAAGLYRQWFYNVIQDGEVTEEEERLLQWLEREFGLSDHVDVRVCKMELDQIKRLAAVRNGQLPSMQTSKLLESGEICHWYGPCTFQWSTATQTKSASGEMIVTSERVIFASPTKSFDFSPSKIVDIRLFSDVLEVQSSGRHGAGHYFVNDPRMLEAVLVGVARKHKYILSENFSSNQTRHIPESVRREVWTRDGGKCVRCGARQYLEFDHIIPHAKGGANTVNNVQLLCRKCNNFKKDRI